MMTDHLFAFGVALALRATALLAGALVLALLLRRSSGSARHALWSVTVMGLLVLPLLTLAVPAVRLPVPASMRALGGATRTLSPAESREPFDQVGMHDGVASPAVPGEPSVASPAIASTARAAPSGLPRGTLILVWLVGALLMGGALARGLVKTHRMAVHAAPLRSRDWLAALWRACRIVGVSRRVGLRISPAAATPMAGGLRRPVVILPPSAREWGDDRREAVLLHELVHVKRHDAARHLLARLAATLFWFHPLVWLATRLAVLAREEACDEAVIRLGKGPSIYARHLLSLAGPARLPIPALARLQRPHLEKRVMAILGPIPRARRGTALATAFAAALWAVTVAAAAPAPAPAASDGTSAASHPNAPATYAAPRDAVVPAVTLPSGPAGALVSVQEPSCWQDRLSGDFSGSISYSDRAGVRIVERYGYTNGDRVIQMPVDGGRACLRSHGPVEFDEDGTRIVSVAPGGWVVLAQATDGGEIRLVMTAGPNGIASEWTVTGARRPFDRTGEEWRDALLDVLGSHWQASRLRGRESTMRGRISSIRGRESSLRGRISSIRGHVSSLRGRISSVRGRESSIRGQISSVRGHESSLRGRISSVRGHESSLRGRISSTRARISQLESARRATRNPDTRSQLEDEIRAVEAEIGRIEAEIAEYDAEGRVADIEAEIAEYDAESRIRGIEQHVADDDIGAEVRAIEAEIESYGADERIRAVEDEIRALDVPGRVGEIEREIEGLDVNRKVREIEGRLDGQLDRLGAVTNRLVGRPR